jgi:DNA-binding NarL/FixJ family response regulator
VEKSFTLDCHPNSSKLIADQLFITGETVKGQVKKILSSLGANDRTRACHHRA